MSVWCPFAIWDYYWQQTTAERARERERDRKHANKFDPIKMWKNRLNWFFSFENKNKIITLKIELFCWKWWACASWKVLSGPGAVKQWKTEKKAYGTDRLDSNITLNRVWTGKRNCLLYSSLLYKMSARENDAMIDGQH